MTHTKYNEIKNLILDEKLEYYKLPYYQIKLFMMLFLSLGQYILKNVTQRIWNVHRGTKGCRKGQKQFY
jgi:hypothetical protein